MQWLRASPRELYFGLLDKIFAFLYQVKKVKIDYVLSLLFKKEPKDWN